MERAVMSKLVTDATGNKLTYQIIGAAMAVHNKLGSGLKEEVYEKALEVELNQQDISVIRQYPVSVEYGGEQVALFYLDLYVEDQVVVEIKALNHQLTNDELAQVINYLKAANAPVGLLFNFGRRKLEYRRVFPAKTAGPVQRTGRDNVIKNETQ
jgi:GxxExxY protein